MTNTTSGKAVRDLTPEEKERSLWVGLRNHVWELRGFANQRQIRRYVRDVLREVESDRP